MTVLNLRTPPASSLGLLCAALACSSTSMGARAQTATPSAKPSATPSATPPADTVSKNAGSQSTGAAVVSPAAAGPAPIKIGSYQFSGSLRTRFENWNFFDAPGFNDSYTFNGTLFRVGIARSRARHDLQLELAVPALFNLPENAIAPAPQGQLGLGANYFAASGRQDASIFPRQAFVRFKNLGSAANSLRLGRFEFLDGGEVTAKDPALNWLKTQRLASRLIGNFGFSHVQRSLDGLHFSHNTPQSNFTLVAARPTEGVFQLNGLGEVKDVDVVYGAFTKPMKTSEARLFGIYYRDRRENVLKVDNRPLGARQADKENIGIATLGAHYVRTFQMGGGAADVLAWGALQGGDWGTQKHRADALALEAGYQPRNMKLKPWLRVGYYRSSGDGERTDNRHRTFFQVLPTPRVYARFPFYNQMNNEDLFAQVIVRPNPKLNLRADVHALRLGNANDLFYAGGGAFQDQTFGFAGRPNPSGKKGLATVFDVSLDYALNPATSLGLYLAHASGRSVISGLFPDGDNANFAFLELTRKF